ncbi:MAG: hypothetical protein ACC628_25785 [Pirellulaceae bacterium]
MPTLAVADHLACEPSRLDRLDSRASGGFIANKRQRFVKLLAQFPWIARPLDGRPRRSPIPVRPPTRYDKLPANVVTFGRRNVFKCDRFTCPYCGRQPGFEGEYRMSNRE